MRKRILKVHMQLLESAYETLSLISSCHNYKEHIHKHI